VFELEGAEEFLAALKKKGALLESQQEKIMLAGAEILKAEAENRAPVLTGNLKQRIFITEVEKDYDGSNFVYVGPSDPGKGFYGRMLEFGTVKMRARPWFEPSYLSKKAAMLVAMAAEAKKVIEG